MNDPLWRQSDGTPLACIEKIKMLNENIQEIRQAAQDALADALLMGCDEEQIRAVLQDLMANLENPFRGKKK